MQTIYYHFRKHTTLQNGKNSARKQVPQSARLSEGGGCNRHLGNAQIDPTFFKLGLPLQVDGVSHIVFCHFWSPVDITQFLWFFIRPHGSYNFISRFIINFTTTMICS